MPVLIVIEYPHRQERNQDYRGHKEDHITLVLSKDFIRSLAIKTKPRDPCHLAEQVYGCSHLQNFLVMGNNLPAFKFLCTGKDFINTHLALFIFIRCLPRTAKDHVTLIHDLNIDQTLSLPQSLQGLFYGYLNAPISLPVAIQSDNDCPAPIRSP